MNDKRSLRHWGVLGMHWGVITGGKSGSSSGGHSRTAKGVSNKAFNAGWRKKLRGSSVMKKNFGTPPHKKDWADISRGQKIVTLTLLGTGVLLASGAVKPLGRIAYKEYMKNAPMYNQYGVRILKPLRLASGR